MQDLTEHYADQFLTSPALRPDLVQNSPVPSTPLLETVLPAFGWPYATGHTCWQPGYDCMVPAVPPLQLCWAVVATLAFTVSTHIALRLGALLHHGPALYLCDCQGPFKVHYLQPESVRVRPQAESPGERLRICHFQCMHTASY